MNEMHERRAKDHRRAMLRFTIRETVLATTIVGLTLGWCLDHYRFEFNRYLRSRNLTVDQQLIVACYKLRVDEVVSSLRKGAHMNARFGDTRDNVDPFYDRWEGGT